MLIDPTSRSAQTLSTSLAPGSARDAGSAGKAVSAPLTTWVPARNATGVSSEVRGLAREMAARPPVDSAKVAAIRSAMAEGRYVVDAGKLADAMISSATAD